MSRKFLFPSLAALFLSSNLLALDMDTDTAPPDFNPCASTEALLSDADKDTLKAVARCNEVLQRGSGYFTSDLCVFTAKKRDEGVDLKLVYLVGYKFFNDFSERLLNIADWGDPDRYVKNSDVKVKDSECSLSATTYHSGHDFVFPNFRNYYAKNTFILDKENGVLDYKHFKNDWTPFRWWAMKDHWKLKCQML